MEHLRANPNALWRLDNEGSSQTDYSGYNNPATITGTPPRLHGLSSYTTHSKVFGNSITCAFPNTVYDSSRPATEPFSVAAAIYPFSNNRNDVTAKISVLSHNNALDGLWLDGKTVNFTTIHKINGDDYSNDVLTDSPVMYYRFEDVIPSATMTDSSPNGHNGTYNTAASYATGILGTSLDVIDASHNAYVLAADWPNLSATHSIEFWINPRSVASNKIIASARADSTAAAKLFVYLNAGNLTWDTGASGTGSNRWNTGYFPPVNIWTHIVLVRTSTNRMLYVNGQLQATGPAGTLSNPAVHLRIGTNEADNNTDAFDGLIDEFAIYNTALAADRIASHYNTDVSFTCKYNYNIDRPMQVFGVHTSSKNSLYMDGSVVAEVNIPEGHAEYSKSGSLYAGQSSDATRFVGMNMVALYPNIIKPLDIKKIFSDSIRLKYNIPGSPISTESVDILNVPGSFTVEWKESVHWRQAKLTRCVIDSGVLRAQRSNGVTQSAEWVDTVNLMAMDPDDHIESASLYYTGYNIIVYISEDGVTWTEHRNGNLISALPTGVSPYLKNLYIRVVFTEGQDDSYIDYMRLIVKTSPTTDPTAGRTVQVGPLHSEVGIWDNVYREDRGVRFVNDKLIISGDIDNPVSTIELWIKMNATGDMTLIDSGTVTKTLVADTGGTSYWSGTAQLAGVVGPWQIFHFVTSSPITASITINGVEEDASHGGDINIGRIILYHTALTGSQISSIVENYTGLTSAPLLDESAISIAEPSDSVIYYAHDWTNTR